MLTIKGYGFYETGTVDVTVDGINCPVQSITRDANNEKIIMENLESFYEGRTAVIIAHRLSTVKNADQIIVMDKGSVVEIGNHDDLTKKKGVYYTLVKNQLELGQ